MNRIQIRQLVTHVHGLSCKNYVASLGTAMADVSVVPFKTYHQYVGSVSWNACAQYGKHLASSLPWCDVSHYLWLHNSHVWFSSPPKETVSSLRSCSACLLLIGSQIQSPCYPQLLCVTQGNCYKIHCPSSCVSRFIGPEVYAVWGPYHIKII